MRTRFFLAAALGALLAACASAREPTIKTLHAQGAYAPQAVQMMTFGRLVGDWDLVIEYLQEDGSWQRAAGEWHFGWILQGRAIQDVWTAYRPGAQPGDPEALMGYGTTVRVYDANTGAWRVNWMGVLNHNYVAFSAIASNDNIVMDATDDDGQPFQWIFYDITENSFRWRAQASPDNGQTWNVAQRMTASRRIAH